MSDATNNWGDRVLEDLAPLVCPLDPQRNARRRRLLGAPLPIQSGLLLWFRGDAGTWQDTSGTTPAVANNDPVGRWDDNSGNGNNGTQGNNTQRPLLATGQIDGINGVNSQGLTLRGLAFTLQSLTGDATVYVVGKRATSKILIPVGSSTGTDFIGIFSDNNVYFAPNSGSNFNSLAYTGGTGSIMCRWSRTGTGAPVFKGGGMAATTMGVSGTGAGTVGISSILGRIGTASIVSDDVICEILMYNTNDANTKAIAEAYLQTRYPSATF